MRAGVGLMVDLAGTIWVMQVEWDTDPGRQEVQAITTSTYIGANEIQVIATTASRVDAVQTVQTTATNVREVQVCIMKGGDGHDVNAWAVRSQGLNS